MIFTHQTITGPVDETCDVCVVGSGAGGATVAKELAEAGLSVILLEEGGHHQTSDFQKPISPESIINLYRDAGTTVIMGKPNILFTEGRCLGGSTTINGGMSWRTPEKILKRWQWERDLTDLTPKKMEPFFKRVEDIIHVNPVHPVAKNQDSETLKKGAEILGYRYRENLRSHDICVGTNQCNFGCPTGGKQSTLVSYIPAFIKAGGRVYTNCRVKKIRFRGRSAAGVTGVIIDPQTKQKKFKVRIRSRVTVVCGGAIQTPSLLLRSRIPNKSKLLGKNLFVHPNAKVIGVFDNPIYGWKGVNQAYQITEFMDEGIIMGINFIPPPVMALALPFYGSKYIQTLKEIFNHCVVGAALIEDTARGHVVNLPYDLAMPIYNMNLPDFEKALRATALLSEVYFAAGAKRVYLPFAHLHEIHTVDEIRKIYQYPMRPADLELMTVHIMGTCQMGIDPAHAVVNPFGEVYQVPGLFVADASIFPTSIGVNPQETIMALATRTAFYIAENMSRYTL